MERNCKFAGIFALIFLALVVFSGGQVFADAASDARIEKLEAALKQIQIELAAIKAEQKAGKSVDQDQIETVVTKVLEDKGTVATTPGWLNKLSFGGDFRYRHESADTYADTDWQKGRSRNRFRARFKLGVKIDDEIDLKFRFASGSADPLSANQTMGDSFSTKDFLLDRAYIDWHPETMDGLNIYAGKMKFPFYVSLKNKLIWDDNVSPEGGAITLVRDLDDDMKIHFAGGGFWVDESSRGADTSLWGIQSYVEKDLENQRTLLGGISYYDYGNIKNKGSLETWNGGNSFFGNTAVNDTYANDFNIFELFSEYGFMACNMPMAIGGNWVRNFAADSGKDTAWFAGITINKTSTPGTWQARYNYRETESDAVLGLFSDAAFANGVTDSKGSEFGFDYMLAKNVMWRLTYYLNERGEEDDDVRKLQADIRIKF